MSPNAFSTSKQAYEFCKTSGLLSERVALVLRALIDAPGPMNQTMTHQAVIRVTGKMMEKYSISPRFAVLERMGLIREAGRGDCPVSGRQTVFYEPTSCRPLCTEAEAMNVPRRADSISKMKLRIAELETENNQLKELMEIRSDRFRDREQKIAFNRVEMQTALF